ncbi:alcohol dehydrogenase catalytic domain-containing protein [Corynebacterium phoceense]|nr:alcohol dehydrogenase catalytic domain-containing protein [Corynebacterium phoceense]
MKMELTRVCSSGLWAYRGLGGEIQDRVMGHEYVGVVEEVGAEVKNVKAGALVVGPFVASDNTCEICRAGYQSFCTHV